MAHGLLRVKVTLTSKLLDQDPKEKKYDNIILDTKLSDDQMSYICTLAVEPWFAWRMGCRKVGLLESQWNLSSPHSSAVWNDMQWQTSLLWPPQKNKQDVCCCCLLPFLVFQLTDLISKCDFGWLHLVLKVIAVLCLFLACQLHLFQF